MTLDFALQDALWGERDPWSRLSHQQPPFACDVAGQGPPSHVAWLQLMTFGREHVPTLESETGRRAG